MSPGSYMSSESNAESAGSSNSIDDTEIPYGMPNSLFEYFSFNNIVIHNGQLATSILANIFYK